MNVASLMARTLDKGMYSPYKASGFSDSELQKLSELFFEWNPRQEDSMYNFWDFRKYRDGKIMIDRYTWRNPYAVESFDAFLAELLRVFESNSINRYFKESKSPKGVIC